MSFPPTVGRYRIDRVLGSGAFASVWLGQDDALASDVAIKVLSGSLIDDLDVRNRFLEEARILRRADSARLVRVHDIGELPDGRPYFVMSYADRGTLADRMRERPLPVNDALALAEEIAHGVEVINTLGVIHRDLKPSNVLFQSTPDGGEKLLIADLGLAKALAHASGAFTLPVGTPGYMSPEQARFGGGLDVRADVYGLGALTYHMLTGRPPGPAPVKAPPSQLREGLPPAFDQVILRALEVEREKRWPTAEAFAEALATLRPTTGPGAQTAPAHASGPSAAEPEFEVTTRDRYRNPAQQPPSGQPHGHGPPPMPLPTPGQDAGPGHTLASDQGPGQPVPPGMGQGPPPNSPQGQGPPPNPSHGQGPPPNPSQGQGPPPNPSHGQGPPPNASHGQGPPPHSNQPPQQQQAPSYQPPPQHGGPGYAEPEPPTQEDRPSDEDDVHTSEMRVPPRQAPPGEPATIVDQPGGSYQPTGPGQGPDQDRTVSIPTPNYPPQGPGGQTQQQPPYDNRPGDEGKTAVFQGQGGPQGQPQGPPPTGFQAPPQGQGGSQKQSGGPGLMAKLKGRGSSKGPGGPPGPGGAAGPGGRPAGGGAPKKNMVPLIIATVLLTVAVIGGLLLGNLFSGGDKKEEEAKKPAVPADFAKVADASGKIQAAVPKSWPKGQAENTWAPAQQGLPADTAQRPVLRAAPSVAAFKGNGKGPGVFIGLTTDLKTGPLPPANITGHPLCTKGPTENYVSPDKALSGTITRFTACKAGTPTVTEVALKDKGGKFGVWVRVKESDNRNATRDILNNLKLTAP